MDNLVALIIFTILCNHDDSLLLKHFHHPKQKLYLLSSNSLSLHPWPPPPPVLHLGHYLSSTQTTPSHPPVTRALIAPPFPLLRSKTPPYEELPPAGPPTPQPYPRFLLQDVSIPPTRPTAPSPPPPHSVFPSVPTNPPQSGVPHVYAPSLLLPHPVCEAQRRRWQSRACGAC